MAVMLAAWLSALPAGSVCATLGNPQLGKSWAMKTAAQSGAFGRLAVFEPYAKRDRKLYRAGLSPAAPWVGVYCSPRDLAKYPRELLSPPGARVVVVPESETDDPVGLGREFSRVASVLWATGGVDLLGEEVGLYGREAERAMMRLASGGGHALMRLFLVCQSLGRIQKDARRHLNSVVSLPTGEPEDLESLRQRCGPEFVQRVAALDPEDGSHAVAWRVGRGVAEVQTR